MKEEAMGGFIELFGQYKSFQDIPECLYEQLVCAEGNTYSGNRTGINNISTGSVTSAGEIYE